MRGTASKTSPNTPPMHDPVVNEPLCRLCRIRSATPCRFCGDDFAAFIRMFTTGREAGYAQGVQDAYFESYADNVKAGMP